MKGIKIKDAFNSGKFNYFFDDCLVTGNNTRFLYKDIVSISREKTSYIIRLKESNNVAVGFFLEDEDIGVSFYNYILRTLGRESKENKIPFEKLISSGTNFKMQDSDGKDLEHLDYVEINTRVVNNPYKRYKTNKVAKAIKLISAILYGESMLFCILAIIGGAKEYSTIEAVLMFLLFGTIITVFFGVMYGIGEIIQILSDIKENTKE